MPQADVDKALSITQGVAKQLGCEQVSHEAKIAILSVLGIGIRTHTGVGLRMFEALSQADINVEMINTSAKCGST